MRAAIRITFPNGTAPHNADRQRCERQADRSGNQAEVHHVERRKKGKAGDQVLAAHHRRTAHRRHVGPMGYDRWMKPHQQRETHSRRAGDQESLGIPSPTPCVKHQCRDKHRGKHSSQQPRQHRHASQACRGEQPPVAPTVRGPHKAEGRPDDSRKKRHVGHERERKNEVGRIEAERSGSDKGLTPRDGKFTHGEIEAAQADDRKDPRRDSKRKRTRTPNGKQNNQPQRT